MSLVVGEVVGPYRIVEQLGQGGMATVFKGYHAALDRYVAIKVLHPAFKEDPTFLARFQREARVVAKLEHPNIVPVYDFAEHNGAPYLVMKFIEGETLKARLARGPLTLRETLRIIEAVGSGLAHAHKQGILHRDIKSSNVMLAADGGIYLADFGLARIAIAGESTLSMDSMIGTPHYMSPEQAKGVKDLDAGADIYSLGVVLYELVVGRLPFSADTPFAIIHDHIYTPLPLPRSANPNVPESIERVLLKSLAKERSDRYSDVTQMVAAFREAVAGAESGIIALPMTVPVSPVAPTAPGATVVAAKSDGDATHVKPPPGRPKSKYKFRWWHAAAGLVTIVCICLGLGALANRNRQNAAGTPPTPGAGRTLTPGQLPADTPLGEALNTPAPGGLAVPRLEEATQMFAEGKNDQALAALEAAMQSAPEDPGAHLAAGDLALAHGFALNAINYYVPGIALMQDRRDEPLAVALRSHGVLALYVAAADRGAEQFLREQIRAYPDPGMAQAMLQRWRIFHADADQARADLEEIIKDNPFQGLRLLVGDYFLHAGQPVEAAARYELVKGLGANERNLPGWVLAEAECRLKTLAEQKARATLTPTCEPLPALVGPGLP